MIDPLSADDDMPLLHGPSLNRELVSTVITGLHGDLDDDPVSKVKFPQVVCSHFKTPRFQDHASKLLIVSLINLNDFTEEDGGM